MSVLTRYAILKVVHLTKTFYNAVVKANALGEVYE